METEEKFVESQLVLVTREWEQSDCHTWDDWNSEMVKCVGKVGRVSSIGSHGMRVRFVDGDHWIFPSFLLAAVTKGPVDPNFYEQKFKQS